MRRAGVRTRVVAGFAAGALAVSTSMALVSYELTRSSLLAGRERSTVRAAYLDARVVGSGLGTTDPDIPEVLRSLDTGSNRHAVLWRDGRWYARSADTDVTKAVPTALQRLVGQQRPAVQHVRVSGTAYIVVGVPLSATVALYEVESVADLDQALRQLVLALTLAAAVTACAAAGLGWYTTRYALRPLRSVAVAAQEIASGDFTARLDPAVEPDLAHLTSSFNDMVDQLAQRIERDRRFAADVSHELRSPLQTLAACASVLHRRREHLDERTAIAAGLVVEEIARFESLVDDLLELARSDQTAHRDDVDIADLARRAAAAHDLPVDIVQIHDDIDVRWNVDARRIAQVLANLLDNAAKYGGGATALRLGRSDHDGWYIEVDDDGPGVAPEDRAVIFDRFVRGRAAGARGHDNGTGLGLALVAQHAAAHGGRVSILDRPGGGARFRVELASGST